MRIIVLKASSGTILVNCSIPGDTTDIRGHYIAAIVGTISGLSKDRVFPPLDGEGYNPDKGKPPVMELDLGHLRIEAIEVGLGGLIVAVVRNSDGAVDVLDIHALGKTFFDTYSGNEELFEWLKKDDLNSIRSINEGNAASVSTEEFDVDPETMDLFIPFEEEVINTFK